jgi:hypothetical protein
MAQAEIRRTQERIDRPSTSIAFMLAANFCAMVALTTIITILTIKAIPTSVPNYRAINFVFYLGVPSDVIDQVGLIAGTATVFTAFAVIVTELDRITSAERRIARFEKRLLALQRGRLPPGQAAP